MLYKIKKYPCAKLEIFQNIMNKRKSETFIGNQVKFSNPGPGGVSDVAW